MTRIDTPNSYLSEDSSGTGSLFSPRLSTGAKELTFKSCLPSSGHSDSGMLGIKKLSSNNVFGFTAVLLRS